MLHILFLVYAVLQAGSAAWLRLPWVRLMRSIDKPKVGIDAQMAERGGEQPITQYVGGNFSLNQMSSAPHVQQAIYQCWSTSTWSLCCFRVVTR
ncbi:hypothetical protein F5Y15DRAFT_140748 [Xylariaceae sp. FL0016]|nr:hypothetical protein F5Y15DRAFT_140748 [Xylariaceae sp. FL0016]